MNSEVKTLIFFLYWLDPLQPEFLPRPQPHATFPGHELYLSDHLLLSYLNLPQPRPSTFFLGRPLCVFPVGFQEHNCFDYVIIISTHNTPKPPDLKKLNYMLKTLLTCKYTR